MSRHTPILLGWFLLAVAACGTSASPSSVASLPAESHAISELRSTVTGEVRMDSQLRSFECSPGREVEQLTDLIIVDVVEAIGPNTPEEALITAQLFSGAREASIRSGTADLERTDVNDTEVVLDLAEPAHGKLARVTINRYDDTWVVTGALLCVPNVKYDEDE
jgi:hypothetical protein